MTRLILAAEVLRLHDGSGALYLSERHQRRRIPRAGSARAIFLLAK